MLDKTASLELLDRYVRIPTISSQINSEMVAQVQTFWQKIGLNFELLLAQASYETKGGVCNPALFTEIAADAPNAPTILLYGHWDVQPTGNLADWQWEGQPCPPFEPTYFVADRFLGSNPTEATAKVGPDETGQITLVARGSADNKGQHLANILGVLEAKKSGKLQWNVKIILDGEEEIGSPNLAAIVQSHKDKLKADFMVGSDGPKSDNRPTLLLGVRGLLALTVRCDNGTNRMLHSGNYGNVVPNPALPLTRLLDEMYHLVTEMGRQEKAFRQEIDRFFDKNSPDRPRFEPFLYPTFNINSLMSEGATSGQRRTILPGWAEASIDVRLIPGMQPQQVYNGLAELTEKANHQTNNLTFTISQDSATAASYTSPEREGFEWLKQVLTEFWGDDLRLIPLLGGTLPNDIFTEGLNMASYWLPAANSNNRQHDTNEHFVLEHFFRQQEFYARLAATPYH